MNKAGPGDILPRHNTGEDNESIPKIVAVALDTGSAVGWLAVNATEVVFEAATDKIGQGTVTGFNGITYMGSDYKDAAGRCDDSTFSKGLKKAKEV